MKGIPQKIGAVVFGVGLFVLLLELGLRVGGWLFLVKQDWKNRQSLRNQGEIRILCLGESTTALGGEDSYPRQLERLLNEGQPSQRVTVINKGVPAITSTHILDRVQAYVEEYQPHLVIAMMGINDVPSAPYRERDPTEVESRSNPQSFWQRHSRVVHLAALIRDHWRASHEEIALTKKPSLRRMIEAVEKSSSVAGYTRAAAVCRAAGEHRCEKALLDKALILNQDYGPAWAALGLYWKRRGEFLKAAESFERALATQTLSKDQILNVYTQCAESYQLAGQSDKAITVYQEAIAFFPPHPAAYGEIGKIYLQKNDRASAEKYLSAQLKINPKATLFYGPLAHVYRQAGQAERAEALLRRGLARNPQALDVAVELGYHWLETGQWRAAREVLKEVADRSSSAGHGIRQDIRQRLADLYQRLNEPVPKDLAREMMSDPGELPAVTRENYHRLYAFLREKHIPLVVVQYPLRPLDPLKRLFSSSEGVVFVDNEKVFQQALRQVGYDALFWDRFAGNFGHCTAEGNRLLAQSIRQQIMPWFSFSSEAKANPSLKRPRP